MAFAQEGDGDSGGGDDGGGGDTGNPVAGFSEGTGEDLGEGDLLGGRLENRNKNTPNRRNHPTSTNRITSTYPDHQPNTSPGHHTNVY